MQHGNKGMGMHKHGVSGHSGASPKLRQAKQLAAKRESEENAKATRKKKNAEPQFSTVSELLRAKGVNK